MLYNTLYYNITRNKFSLFWGTVLYTMTKKVGNFVSIDYGKALPDLGSMLIRWWAIMFDVFMDTGWESLLILNEFDDHQYLFFIKKEMQNSKAIKELIARQIDETRLTKNIPFAIGSSVCSNCWMNSQIQLFVIILSGSNFNAFWKKVSVLFLFFFFFL
jgi:hypothetical protein